MERGIKAKLADEVGISRQFVSEIFLGNRRPSPDVAKRLEEATGIDRLSWLYPDEFSNPMIRSAADQDGEHGTAAN